MELIEPYYVCYKEDEEEGIQFVTHKGHYSTYLHFAIIFNTKEEALSAIKLNKEEFEDDEFSYMRDFNIYDGCSVGEITTMLTEVDRANYTIEELDFSVRTYNALKRKGINSLASILTLTDEELLNIRNINVRSAREIKDKLDEMKLTLRDS